MNKTEFDRRVERIKDVNRVVEELDPAVRRDAFLLLTEYIDGGILATNQIDNTTEEAVEEAGRSDQLILEHASNKPYENVKLIAAYFYSLYGKTSIGIEELRRAADDFGLTIPERPDMTLKQATKNKKKLFTLRDSGFAPTVHGEQFLKDTYSVERGTMTKPPEED